MLMVRATEQYRTIKARGTRQRARGILRLALRLCPLKEVIEKILAAKPPAETKKTLEKHFADESNKTFDYSYSSELLQKIMKIHSDIGADPDFRRLIECEKQETYDIDELESLVERVSKFIDKHTRLFHNEYRFALNKFAKVSGKGYRSGMLSSDARRAYFLKYANVARVLKLRIEEIQQFRI